VIFLAPWLVCALLAWVMCGLMTADLDADPDGDSR
jgi:hypothetical protein